MEIEGFEQIKEIFNEGIDKNVTYLFGVSVCTYIVYHL